MVAENTAGDLRAVAKICGIDERSLAEFYRLFARTEQAITVFSQGVNQSSAGTDKVNSIINCHLLTGRIGGPGMGPFSVTGQPNAMGGREVGGLANMLAAHMDLDNAEHRRIVQEFWNSPAHRDRPGLKAVDLFDAIHDGSVKAVWIMATNPVVSLPDADKVREALQRCELVVVSDCVAAHRHQCACARAAAGRGLGREGRHGHEFRSTHLAPARLPAAAGRGEAGLVDHLRGREAPGLHARRSISTSAHEIFSEHARLSGAGNDGSRAFDISGLRGLDRDGVRRARARFSGRCRSQATPGTAAPVERRTLLPPGRQGALRADDAARAGQSHR